MQVLTCVRTTSNQMMHEVNEETKNYNRTLSTFLFLVQFFLDYYNKHQTHNFMLIEYVIHVSSVWYCDCAL